MLNVCYNPVFLLYDKAISLFLFGGLQGDIIVATLDLNNDGVP
ncbi:hypothetical protein RchiOBHm_Chr3g0496121 [Rosa chinensis]|uniref:Uncharacterized protein n=1 Tax=Rosa chinensis TaxID=74649 RepID=A0A2P6RHE0_ROSCH|nr:hypothetical protein RchiOBHm_Chr3g0496121 [Rosa chinensis]